MERYHSIAAAILSFAVTITEFSELKLGAWRHFALAVLAILILYFAFYFVINRGIYLYNRYLQRANIKADEAKELQELNDLLRELYCSHIQYKQTENKAYQKVIYLNICSLYNQSVAKVYYIEHASKSGTLKYRFNLSDEAIKAYRGFCEYIQGEYDL